MTTKTSAELTLRDRLSRLSYLKACRLLGEEGRRLIREGGSKYEIEIDEQVHLSDDHFRLSLPGAEVTIALMAGARDKLYWNCGSCDRACEHAGAAFSLILEETLDWSAFGIWLSMLLQARGEDVLRVKGILAIDDAAPPVVVNGVQHLVHPPQHLDRWPDDDRRSRLVFIVRDLTRAAIEDSFATFHQALAAPALVA
jgi:G3E family GTPase